MGTVILQRLLKDGLYQFLDSSNVQPHAFLVKRLMSLFCINTFCIRVLLLLAIFSRFSLPVSIKSVFFFIVLVNLERVIDSFVPSDSNFYYWISFDVWGLAPIHFICGVEYYIYCTNAFSRLTWLFPLKCNYEVSNFFIHLKDKVETYFYWNQKFSYRWRHIL